MPLIAGAGGSVDADDTEVAVEHMSEEELLKGLEGLAPPEEQPEPDDDGIRRSRHAGFACVRNGPASPGRSHFVNRFAASRPCGRVESP